MKATNIKRLEMALAHIEKAADILDNTYDKVWNEPEEFIIKMGLPVKTTLTIAEICRDIEHQEYALRTFIKNLKENENG